MTRRRGWDITDLSVLPSPSVGTSIGVLLDLLTAPGDGVILQPPVFTDFEPLVQRAGRRMVRNPLVFERGRYEMNFEHLEFEASDPSVTAMILCNPHNPVGRAWSKEELTRVAVICATHGVVVIADEIHADLALPRHRFTPFAATAPRLRARWAPTHGPMKTFGVAGLCDTLLVSDDDEIASAFRATSSALHLGRKNAFGLAAFRAGYEEGEPWLDDLLNLIGDNVRTLRRDLPDPIALVEPEATYLAWLDLRGLGMEVPELASWLTARAGLALSPGHWFGREGAGFARMSIAIAPALLEEAIRRLHEAVAAG